MFSKNEGIFNFQPSLLERLKTLRTELVADAFLKLKLDDRTITGIPPLEPNTTICGPVFTARYADLIDEQESLFEFNRFLIDKVPRNSILVIETSGDITKAGVWGELVSVSAQARGIIGVITNSSIRDTNSVKVLGFPVFTTGKAVHNSNKAYKIVEKQKEIHLNGVPIKPDDIVFADNSGIVVISPQDLKKVVEFAEKKIQDEKKITRLARTGLSLEETHQIMTKQIKEPERLAMTSLIKLGLFAVATSVAIGAYCMAAEESSSSAPIL